MFSTKHKKKAFTLIEMLIVIVIIGILAAALIPRLSSARGRANDVARKADLAQVAAALVAYQIDRGRFPTSGCAAGCALNVISADLSAAGMSSIPTDPNTSRPNSGIGSAIATGQYGYTTITKGGIPGNGFVVIAATETEGGSNRVTSVAITGGTSYDNINLCKNFDPTGTVGNDNNGNCTYNKNSDQLRYIYLY